MDAVKKQYKYLFRECAKEENIVQAYLNLRKNKTSRQDIKNIQNDLDYCVQYMKKMIWNTRPDAEFPEYAFEPPGHTPRIIHEYDKPREIIEPDIIEQWVHHIIVLVLKPIFMKRFHEHSFGSIPKRGIHKGEKLLQKWKHLGYKYLFKMDVRHYYASIRHPMLIRKLREYIKDEWLIYLIEVCFRHHKKGLPLGFYLSQWLGNAMLEDLDLALSKDREYIRYMDDIVVAGNNKHELQGLIPMAEKILSKHRLKLKGNYQVFNLEKRNLDFLGFVFTDGKVRLRKRLSRRIKQCVRRIDRCTKHNKEIHIRWLRQLLSYKGWMDHSDSHHYYLTYVKPVISFKRAQQIISRYDRRKANDKLAERVA